MRTGWPSYLVALAAVAVSLGVRAAFDPWLGSSASTIFVYGAIAVAAWLGGYWPAIVAAVAGYVASNMLFIAPRGILHLGASREYVQLLGYTVSALIICALGGFMHAARARLAESEQRFRSFMENSPANVFLKDEEGRYVFMNRSAEALIGAGAWHGKTDKELLPGETARSIMAHDQQVLRADEVHSYELTLARPEGERRFLSTKFPLRDARGSRYVGSITVDVTEQKRAEEGLQLVTDTMSVGIVRVSKDLRYVWVNRIFASWAGLTPPEMAGRPIADVIGEDGVRDIDPYIEQLRQGKRVEYERLARFRALGPRWMYSLAEPTFDDAGRPNGWVAVVSDIHERKRAQEALREADRRKDEFLATLAHELRNPLAPIRNAVALLGSQSHLTPEVEWSRAVIDRQVDQMTRLIEDLLDIARISSGKLLLRREIVDLSSVIDLALETSRPHIDAARHRLGVNLDPSPVWLDADPTRLAQLLSNLLNNAAKYTPPAGSISLRTHARDEEAAIVVEDTGRGFPPEMAERIFEPFSQWTPDAQSAGGLGIGLALVRGIVELHGGSVIAESRGPGTGSRFTVRLPVARRVAAAAPSDAPAAGAGGPGVKVLVADDNRDAADTLARLLALNGHDVRVAYDGVVAIELADAFEPQVAVLDIGMPRANGYEVAKALRRKYGDALRLVALTGWGQEHDRRHAIEAGFNEHVTKPADPQVLNALIRESLKSACSAAPPSSSTCPRRITPRPC